MVSPERPQANYLYPTDGFIRRQLHEFGRNRYNFYDEAFARLDIKSSDVVLDIGAGNGADALKIATTYHPRLIFLLEPMYDGETAADFDLRYLHLGNDIAQKGLHDIVLLPSPGSGDHTPVPESQVPEEAITYLAPVAGRAEHLPLPNGSLVDKQLMIHSAYHFVNHLDEALAHAARVMAPGGMGLAITNGPDDKLKFKEILKNAAVSLQSEFPGTVSSLLDYHHLGMELMRYFEYVSVVPYKDEMVITEEEYPAYQWSYNSYRHLFYPQIDHDGRWDEVRERCLEEPVKNAIQDKGEWVDTIDIAAVYYGSPRPQPLVLPGQNIWLHPRS